MTRLLVAAALVVVAVGIAFVLRRRAATDAPTQPRTWSVPAQLHRADFARPDAAWLVAVFTSATCSTCAAVASAAQVLTSDAVAVDVVEFGARRRLHERYGIHAVPITVITGGDGAVVRSFVGPVTATDLWAAVADARG